MQKVSKLSSGNTENDKVELKKEFNAIKEITLDMLRNIGESITFHNAEIFVLPPYMVNEFSELDKKLEPCRKNSIRQKAYTINKIVNLLNPETPAYSYDLTLVEKYVYLSTKTKCIEEAKARVEISANIYRRELTNLIEANSSYSEDFIEKLKEELEEQIIEERKKVSAIVADNSLCKDIRISGFKNKIQYGQINYGYYGLDKNGNKAKRRTNKHLSIIYPNVFFLEPNNDIDKHRHQMRALYLEKEGYIEISRDIFVKYDDERRGI